MPFSFAPYLTYFCRFPSPSFVVDTIFGLDMFNQPNSCQVEFNKEQVGTYFEPTVTG